MTPPWTWEIYLRLEPRDGKPRQRLVARGHTGTRRDALREVTTRLPAVQPTGTYAYARITPARQPGNTSDPGTTSDSGTTRNPEPSGNPGKAAAPGLLAHRWPDQKAPQWTSTRRI